ncbi:hypothetical protein [Aerosakkonema funiforme]|uniref:hypothetical protein n=1 Tax=Aerosakkonema funiforme TaxID=1246630 RepID=UPI0035B8CF5E
MNFCIEIRKQIGFSSLSPPLPYALKTANFSEYIHFANRKMLVKNDAIAIANIIKNV